jgi:hypothetical protein
MGELPPFVVPIGAFQYNEQVLSHEPIIADSEQKQVQFVNKLKQLQHLDRRPTNESVVLAHLEPVVCRQYLLFTKPNCPIIPFNGHPDRFWTKVNRIMYLRTYQFRKRIATLNQNLTYCEKIDHNFKFCPFVDERLPRLLREEMFIPQWTAFLALQ